MLLRNPWSLNQAEIDSETDELMKNEEIQSIDQLLQIINFGDIKSLIKAANKKIWLDEEFTGSVPEHLINNLIDLSCSILHSEDHQFVTSDFPVIYELYETENGDCYFKTISMPINPYYMLFYSKDPIAKSYRNRMKTISNKSVDHLNQLYMKIGIDQSRLIIAREESVLKQIVDSN